MLEASLIGHDLTWGVTKLRKVERQTPAVDQTGAALAELETQSADLPAA